jgi:hypothetical protein
MAARCEIGPIAVDSKEGKHVRKKLVGASFLALALCGVAWMAGAQGPPPRGEFGRRGPGPGPGGPMDGMFSLEGGGLMGGYGGKTVLNNAYQANFTNTNQEQLVGNAITTTTTGTVARGTDGSVYYDVKLPAIGPWAAAGKVREFIYIRNLSNSTEYIVDVSRGTYRSFSIRQHDRPANRNPNPAWQGKAPRKGPNSVNSDNVSVQDNPNGTYVDGSTHYPVDDKTITRTIPAGLIGNLNQVVTTSERWYSSTMDLVLGDSNSDPRFGTRTHKLSGIVSCGSSPSCLTVSFTPDPNKYKPAPERDFRRGPRGGDKHDPPPRSQD